MLGRSLIRCAPALLLITASSILLAAPTAAPAAADAKPLDLPVVGPAIDCAALVSEDISTAVGAQVKIASATVVDDGKTAPFCRVQALIEDYAKFELHLPVSNWTQRFVAGSGPGSSQQTNGFVTMSRQDIGHRDDEDAFANNYQLRIDFAYRIVHLEVVAAKTLIARYYNQAPKFSYYNACSEPGREGMMEVQRFPDDFDGAVTGCPPINDTINNGLYEAWNIRTNTRADGSLIITSDKLPILHQAVLGECDTLDGIKDGIISDPLNCHPKLTEVVCKPGQDTSSCLTTEQVHAALELYRGAHDDKGGKLEPIGVLPGSELQWVMVIAPNPPQPGRPRFANDREGTVLALRSEFSDPPLGTTWKLADLKFDRASFDAFTKSRYLYDATNPDLSAFAHAGHKLIIWQGLADTNVLPAHVILYYTALQKQMGANVVDQFVRMYLLPEVGHCGGGNGPSIRDFLVPLQLWVERGIAPGALPGTHVLQQARGMAAVGGGGGQAPQIGGQGPPLEMGPGGPPQTETAKPDLTRPIYPYPYTQHYIGTGDVKDAANFTRGPARPAPSSLFDWWGADFYKPGYMKWCTTDGTSLTCKDAR